MTNSNHPKDLFGLPMTLPSILGGVLGIIIGITTVTLNTETTALATAKVGAIAGLTALAVSIIVIWLIPNGDDFTERYITVSWFEVGIAIGAVMTLVVTNDAAAIGFALAYIGGTITLCTVGYLGIFHIGTNAMAMIAVGSVIFLGWFVVALLIKWAVLSWFEFV
jgi:hypothetical protein